MNMVLLNCKIDYYWMGINKTQIVGNQELEISISSSKRAYWRYGIIISESNSQNIDLQKKKHDENKGHRKRNLSQDFESGESILRIRRAKKKSYSKSK